MMILKKIDAAATISVRHEVLRAGKPISTCVFSGDDLPTTLHLGAFLDEKIIGVVSVFAQSHDYFDGQKAYQIRGMAVSTAYQGKTYGKRLLEFAEKWCFEQQATVIWFHARATAVPFYEKAGYQKLGNAFEIDTIGIHFVMYKKK